MVRLKFSHGKTAVGKASITHYSILYAVKNFILTCAIFLTLLSYRSYECWVEGKWTFSDPWGYPEASVKPPSALNSFSVTQIVHGTHKEDCESILQTGFKACQLKIDSQENKFTWSGEKMNGPGGSGIRHHISLATTCGSLLRSL